MFVSLFPLFICFLSLHSKGNPIVIMESELSTKSKNDASNLVLNVFVSGNPEPSKTNITWYFNNEFLTDNLASSKGFDISITRTSAFITPDNGFQLYMEGKYECHVTTSAGTATASHILDIHCELMCYIIINNKNTFCYNRTTISVILLVSTGIFYMYMYTN